MSTVDGFSYIDSVVQIRASDPVIVTVSPPTEEAFVWGLYQFPRIWLDPNGNRLLLRVNMGQDMYGGIGLQKAPQYYASDDVGQTWLPVSAQEVAAPRNIMTMPGGVELCFNGTEACVDRPP